ncbi:tRNA uridine-5-carboxymethylaminomethyl(34) synthesis GTPase MnmE [Bacteroidota bacterium]
MPDYTEDTIVALATPLGDGALSTIRMSGPESYSAIDKIFKGNEKIINCSGNTIHYGRIFDSSDNIIDDVLVSVFKGPNSYTGEDSIEISTHGSQLIVKKIIKELINNKVRLAEPGEFTKRAFLNGKMDLAQAEAVADIIHSRTDASLRGARNQLDGILSNKITYLREKLINISSLLELELDFAEEDIELVSLNDIRKNIEEVKNEIDALLGTYSFGRVIRDGVNVALVGKPNVGKSSLLNYILKESRAIVTDIPGTTRDIIREEVSIDGVLFRLYDTAGIRLAKDSIEEEGILRSREAVENADLVLFISDVITGFNIGLYNQLLELTAENRIIKVVNKIDLRQEININADVYVSAITGKGVDKLLQVLKNKTIGSKSYSEKTAIVSNIRHYNSLERAKENLIKGKEALSKGLTGEFIAIDLRNAEDSLGEIIGKITTDDILNNIFSSFCIGK